MPNNAHVLGWHRPGSPFVLATGVVLLGSVLFSAVLLSVGVVPAWAGVRLVAPEAGVTHQARTAQGADPDAPGRSARDNSSGPAPTSSKNPSNTTGTNPPTPAPTTRPPTEPPPRPASTTRDPKPTRPSAVPSTVDPPSTAAPSAAPAGPRARPAVVPAPAATRSPSPIGGFAPDRVPDVGSRPSAATAPNPPPGTDAAAARASFLPGREMGVRIFAAGLVALIVSIGGLVTLALRRRQF
jgi:hypothetical protein